MCQFCNHGFAILVQKMQSLLAVLGITVVSGGEIVLQIHLEVIVLRSTLAKKGILNISLLSIVSHKLLFRSS
jgi:hypothetical protein